MSTNPQNPNNLHQKRGSISHRQTPQPPYYQPGYPQPTEQQMLYQNQMYYQQGYYPMNQFAPPPNGLYRSQDYSPSHLNVTTATGEKVELEQLNQTPKSQPVALSKQPAPVAATQAPPDEKTTELQRSFKEKVLAKARAKAEALAAEKAKQSQGANAEKQPEQKAEAPVETPAETLAEAVKETAEEAPKQAVKDTPTLAAEATPEVLAEDPAVTNDTKEAQIRAFKESVAARAKKLSPEPVAPEVEEPKTAEPNVEEPSIEEPKVEESAIEEPKVEESAIEEPKVEESAIEEPKHEEPKVEEPNVEESKAEEPEVQEPEVQEPSSAEKPTPIEAVNQERSVTQETIAEEPKAEEAEEAEEIGEPDANSITSFLERVKEAKIIEDPFTFTYSSKVTSPKSELKTGAIKYRYDVAFLLQFQNATKFSSDTVFAKQTEFITRDNNRGGSGRNNRTFKFGMGSGLSGSQGFSKSSSNLRRNNYDMNSRSNSRQNSKRRGASGRGDRKSNRRDRDFEREPEFPSEPVEPLKMSATRWVPKSRASKTTEVKYAPDGVTVLLTEEEVSRKVQSLLNKLTLEYFDSISDEVLEIAEQSKWEENAETLKQVINLTFDKATDEPHWSQMYAMFCAKMMASVSDEIKDASYLNDGKPLTGKILVRKLLLSKCQTEYEKGWSDKLPTNEDGSPLEPEMMTDDYYVAAAAKRRGLGLVRFIGHLFVLGLLSPAVIRGCLFRLADNTTDPTEDTVENLIQLIKTVGPTLDTHKESSVMVDAIFEKVKLIEQAKIPSRLEFALLDLRELRRKGWAGLNDAGPKTISQIHEEEEQKHVQHDQRSHDRNKRSNKSEPRSNSSRNSGWGNSRVSDSDFRRVGQVNSSSSNLGPMNNFKSRSNRKPAAPEQPFERSDSSRQNSQKPEQNRFALLDGDDEADASEAQEVASEENVEEA